MSMPGEPEANGFGMDGTPPAQSAPLAEPSSTAPHLPLPLLPSSSAQPPPRSYSPTRTPTSAEIDAVIAAAIANAPPAPPPPEIDRSTTPLMTNLLPSAVGLDGRVNLFVGNLPYRVRWQDLKDLFRKAGTVLRADVSLGPDNRSRGYGTVLMGSREDAARAIDRFNGFTWQTRTLEVRPDRLPPEYEPQPHAPHHHSAPRPPAFNYHSGPNPPYSHFGPPSHAGWAPGQIHRGPPPGPPGMPHHFSLPGHVGGFGPGAHPGHGGPPSLSHSTSPGSSYGPGGLPLPGLGQNTGGGHQPIGASPLAGSLTSGPTAVSALDNARRNSLSPFAHPAQTDPLPSFARAPSPALPNSRPASSAGKSSPVKADAVRHGAPGTLGPLPPPIFPGVKTVISPPDGAVVPDSQRGSFSSASKSSGPPVAIAMEGLSHQGQHMGPPDTLHDRVVFVSNLPLSMQWQELKDLLRPAGVIIRADVATDPEGRPRGFGTALFAAEKDAATAVNNYHGREIMGHRIRVSLEREINESLSRRGSAAVSTSSLPDVASAEETAAGKLKTALAPLETSSKASDSTATSPVSRVPWSLNTNPAATSATPSRQRAYHEQETPQQSYRNHPPGPIQMPSFAPLDTPGHNPLSPLQRGLPPMTPSMPGFVFNAYPETPPVHPHFMSPGMGPFSPGIPVTSPTGFQYNPFLNAAPGAPIGRYPGPPGPPQGHQNHFSQGSAALGTPTTQAFPNNPIHGYRNGGNSGQGEYFPSFGSVAAPGMNANGNGNGNGPNMALNGFANGKSNGASSANTSEPSSPSARPARPNPSPLNAKDRMASTSSTDLRDIGGIIQSTERIRIDPGTGPSSPTRPGKNGDHGQHDLPELSRVRSGSTVRGDDQPAPGFVSAVGGPAAAVNGHGNNRASIDVSRPNLGVWDAASAERRASFGDIAAGRARE